MKSLLIGLIVLSTTLPVFANDKCEKYIGEILQVTKDLEALDKAKAEVSSLKYLTYSTILKAKPGSTIDGYNLKEVYKDMSDQIDERIRLDSELATRSRLYFELQKQVEQTCKN